MHADLKQGSTPTLDIQTKQKTKILPDSQKRANCEKDWKLKSSIILNPRYFSWKWRQIKLSQSWQREQFWFYCCRQSTSNLCNFSIPTSKETRTELYPHKTYCLTAAALSSLPHQALAVPAHRSEPPRNPWSRDVWNNFPSALCLPGKPTLLTSVSNPFPILHLHNNPDCSDVIINLRSFALKCEVTPAIIRLQNSHKCWEMYPALNRAPLPPSGFVCCEWAVCSPHCSLHSPLAWRGNDWTGIFQQN